MEGIKSVRPVPDQRVLRPVEDTGPDRSLPHEIIGMRP